MQSKILRDTYYDILRTAAMLLVIGVHAVGSITMYAPEGDFYKVIIHILENLNNLGVPIFFALSGYFLLNERIESMRAFYKKRLTRILIPFAVYAWIYIIYFTGIEQSDWLGIPRAYVLGLLTNQVHPTHWFVYTILGLYLVTPFLTKMLQNMSDREIAILMGLCIGGAFLKNVFAAFHMEFGIQDVVFGGGYIYYFLCGYCICRLKAGRIVQKIRRYRIGVIGVLLILHILVSWSVISYLLIPVLMLPVNRQQWNETLQKVFTVINKYSYSV